MKKYENVVWTSHHILRVETKQRWTTVQGSLSEDYLNTTEIRTLIISHSSLEVWPSNISHWFRQSHNTHFVVTAYTKVKHQKTKLFTYREQWTPHVCQPNPNVTFENGITKFLYVDMLNIQRVVAIKHIQKVSHQLVYQAHIYCKWRSLPCLHMPEEKTKQ